MLMQAIAFLQAHQAALGMMIVAILDFAIEVNPKLKGNNLVSQILSFVKPAPPSSQNGQPPAA